VILGEESYNPIPGPSLLPVGLASPVFTGSFDALPSSFVSCRENEQKSGKVPTKGMLPISTY